MDTQSEPTRDGGRRLRALEKSIAAISKNIPLPRLLVNLRGLPAETFPFVIAGAALFGIRFSPGSGSVISLEKIPSQIFDPLLGMIQEYLLADPIGYDREAQEKFHSGSPTMFLLRTVTNQWSFEPSSFGLHSRAFHLFHKIPKQLTSQNQGERFDLESEFGKMTGVSITDFLRVGLVSWIASTSNIRFTREYFSQARNQGMLLPSDEAVALTLDQIAGDPSELMDIYESHRQGDPRLAIYDLNPLLIRPIIRPWIQPRPIPMHEDRLIAPLPELISSRLSTGLFYQFFNAHKEKFSRYFGTVVETYLGKVLEHFTKVGDLKSGEEIRKRFPANRGKVPDWVAQDGSTVMVFECKITRFTRAALTSGVEDDFVASLKQVIKGLGQLYQFSENCKKRVAGLERYHSANNFKYVFVSFEPLFLINSPLFRDFVDQLLIEKGIPKFGWLILSIQQLEALQVFHSAGVSLLDIIHDLQSMNYNEVIEKWSKITGKTYKDSFLHQVDEELFGHLRR